jgi:hypothetical protein
MKRYGNMRRARSEIYLMKTATRAALVIGLLASMGAPAAPAPSKRPVAVVYITEKYVFPTQMTLPAGEVFLVIKNHSRLKRLVVHVKERASATDARQADMDAASGSYSTLLDLKPGTYDLFVPGSPKLTCTLTITP